MTSYSSQKTPDSSKKSSPTQSIPSTPQQKYGVLQPTKDSTKKHRRANTWTPGLKKIGENGAVQLNSVIVGRRTSESQDVYEIETCAVLFSRNANGWMSSPAVKKTVLDKKSDNNKKQSAAKQGCSCIIL